MVDIWYKEERQNITGMDCFFSDLSCSYSGHFYAGSRMVGDYAARDSSEVERIAASFNIPWKWY